MRQEIDILRKLRHQNIILMLDWFETKTEFGVVTELAQGELFEILEEDRKMSEDQIRKIALQLAQALYYLHSNRIIHRDMKPQNILIGSGGVIKLCDFGFARAMSQSTIVLQSIKGTPLYMAPELVQEQPYNHSVDLWSFGIILYELFVGEPPFYSNKLNSLIQLIIKNTVKYPENMSPEFKSFLQGLLQKEPSKRIGWPDLLEHPFLQKTNVDMMMEQKLVEKYADWMNNLATWNPDFRDFKRTEITRADGTKGLIENHLEKRKYDKLPLRELIRNSKKEAMARNAKPALEIYENILEDILDNLNTKVQTEGLSKQAAEWSELNELSEVIFKNFRDFSSFDRLTQNFSKLFLQIVEKALTFAKTDRSEICWYLEHAVKFSRSQVNTIKTCDAFLKLVSQMVNDREASDAEYTAILGFVAAIQDQLSYTLIESNEIIHFVKNQKLLEIVFSSKLIRRKHLSNMDVIEKISMIISPFYGEMICFPLLKPNNVTSRMNRLSAAELSTLLDYNEYVQFTIFTALEKVKWLESVSLDDINCLKILLQFIRISEDCVKQVVANETLMKAIKFNASSFSHKSSDLQELFLQIFTEINKSKQFRIYLECSELIESFDRDSVQFLQMLFFYYVNSLMDEQSFIKTLITPTGSFSPVLMKILEFAKKFLQDAFTKDWSILIKEDFVNGGFLLMGVVDSVIKFLRQLLLQARRTRESLIEYITKISSFNIQVSVFGIYEKMDKDFILSLKGLVILFNLTVELLTVTKEHLLFVELLVKEQTIRNILSFLSDDKNVAINQWPKKLGGGGLFEDCTKSSVLRILEIIFSTVIKTNKQRLLNPLVNQLRSFPGLIASILNAYEKTCAVPESSTTITNSNIPSKSRKPVKLGLIVILLKCPDLEPFVVKEFVASRGIEFIGRNGGLSLPLGDESSELIIGDHLSILTQICISSKDYYPTIHALDFYDGARNLLRCKSEVLKEKICRFIGQLCKYSDFFYEHLERANLFDDLIVLCKDPSSAIRRSACLALGNAAFHSERLYRHLEKAIPLVIELFNDSDERIRTNAIGTVNNLIRNSESLYQTFIDLRVPQLLRDLALRDTSVVN